MRHLYLLLLTLAGATVLAFSACVKAPQVTISTPENIELSADGSSGSITFTANRDWSIRCSESWISVTPSSGQASKDAITVRVSCGANTTYEDRQATVTITAEDAVQTTTIKQPANLGIVLPTQSFNIASDARSIEVQVQANVQYTVSVSADWIKQTGTKGLTSNTLTFSIEQNETYDARSANITIKPLNATVQEQIITVKQAQKDALIVEKTIFDMPYGGGEIEVKVEANVDFDVKTSVDWIHYVSTKAMSNSVVSLVVDENSQCVERQGKITIIPHGDSLSEQEIVIHQAAHPAYEVKSIDLGIVMKRKDGSEYKLLWAECNLGANNPEEYGDYYSWGELVPKTAYNWTSYKWSQGSGITITKYNTDSYYGTVVDNKTQLDLEDDVAHVKLGGSWRIPTHEEFKALSGNCSFSLERIGDVTGVRITSNTNKNSIFLPCTGERGWSASYSDPFGVYWSSTLSPERSDSARDFEFNTPSLKIWFYEDKNRCYGHTIRPVKEG